MSFAACQICDENAKHYHLKELCSIQELLKKRQKTLFTYWLLFESFLDDPAVADGIFSMLLTPVFYTITNAKHHHVPSFIEHRQQQHSYIE